MAKKKRNKPIVELDKPGGKVIAYFESAKKASDLYNINVVNISYNVNGTTRQAKGHYFRFASPVEIASFSAILSRIPESTEENVSVDTAPVDDAKQCIDGPTPVIPEATEEINNQENITSAFARLLEESKKKFQNNSK